MCLFHFDMLDGDSVALDDEGLELEGLNAAEVLAIQAAAEIGHHSLPKRSRPEISVRVRDEQGEPVLSVTVSMTLSRQEVATA